MTDERDEALNHARIKRDAYVALFGPLGQPTPYGEIVLKDLAAFCKKGTESIHMDNQGRLDPYTTIYRDGKKAVAERIDTWLKWRESDVGIRSSNPESAE